MPNIAAALKTEIARVARKETRVEIDQLKKTTASYRSAIAALKRQIADLEKKVGKLQKTKSRAIEDKKSDESSAPSRRFSAKGLKTHRAKLGLSAADYGKLVGVSGLSIYKWEKGEVHPRAAQVAALAQVRGLGKREAALKLSEEGAPR